MSIVSISKLVLWQVTIAVLLDNCQTATRKLEERAKLAEIEQRQRGKSLKNPLDPLLLSLSMDYASSEDLDSRLKGLFKVQVAQVDPQPHRSNVALIARESF